MTRVTQRPMSKKVHVLAEFVCDTCGEPCLRLTTAPLMPDGTVSETADLLPAKFDVECNACATRRRAKEELEYKVARQQRAWQKKASASRGSKSA